MKKQKQQCKMIGLAVLAVLILSVVLVSSQGEYFQGRLQLGDATKPAATTALRGPNTGEPAPQSAEPKPTGSINRAELAKLIVATKQVDASTFKACAPDVVGKWYENYVCYLISKGIMTASPDGFFHGENTVNRAEGAKTFTIAFYRKAAWYSGRITAFSDVLPSDWFYIYVMTLAQNKVLDVQLPANILTSPNLKASKPQFNPGQTLTKKSAVLWAQNISAGVQQ